MSRVGNIEEAQIIGEEFTPMADSNSWIQWVARQADKLTSGNRGSWVTEALILADYTEDSKELRAAYDKDKEAIDSYFENVNVEKVINDAGPGVQNRIEDSLIDTVKNNVPGFIAGSILAAGSIIAIKKFKSND